MFLDMFEDEYRQMQLNPVRLEYLLKDACMLCQPTTTPLSGVEFIKRLPSGDIERARRVREIVMKESDEMKVFFSGNSSVFSTTNSIV
jgi:hypothetical protein